MKKLEKKLLSEFVEKLMRDYTVYAPIKANGFFSFKEITSPHEIRLDYRNSKKPPKEVFLPQSEVMFRYEREEGRVKLESTEEVEMDRTLLGARPCDIKATLLLDYVFDAPDYKDVYYLNKREKTTIIGLGCNSPLSTCFCTSLGGGPFSKEGSDLFLTDIGESFLVEALTDKGARIIGDRLFQDATSDEVELAKRIEAEALRKVISVVEVEGLKEKLDGIVESPFWDTLHEKCLGCGVCTFLCPTCHCFDVVDEAWDERGERVRNWDSCMFPLYTLETSGHNPRPTGRERMRQRVMHKFNYFIVNYGEVACVGCGRCIRECPVNVDIRKIIAEIWAL